MARPLIIGIAGGTGSGKTTLTKRLLEEFQHHAVVIYHDNYYKANAELSLEEREKLNYDHPNAFDTELMLEHLSKLRKGHSIESPLYDYSMHTRSAETQKIEPKEVILIEGILIFHDSRICNQMDIKIFVETDADVRILRRIKRDVLKRGRTIESVTQQYLTTVKPMHELYVEPSKRKADIIIPEGGKNLVALDMLFKKIAAHTKEPSVFLEKE